MVAASDRLAVAFQLSGGQCHDAPQGRLLLENYDLRKLLKLEDRPKKKGKIYLAMNKGYEDDVTLQLVKDKGFNPLVPPKSNRKKPWKYNKKLYKRRNEVERLFRRLNGIINAFFQRFHTRIQNNSRSRLTALCFRNMRKQGRKNKIVAKQ
jgi:transposase